MVSESISFCAINCVWPHSVHLYAVWRAPIYFILIGERERANLVYDFSIYIYIYIYIYICTGVALRNLIGRFKHAQRANVRPAQTSSGQA